MTNEEIENVCISFITAGYQKTNKDAFFSFFDQYYDSNIEYYDWENRIIVGKDTLKSFYQEQLSPFNSIERNVISVAVDQYKIFLEIENFFNGSTFDSQKILHVLSLNDNEKITRIETYLLGQVPEDVLWQKKLAEFRKRDPFIYP